MICTSKVLAQVPFHLVLVARLGFSPSCECQCSIVCRLMEWFCAICRVSCELSCVLVFLGRLCSGGSYVSMMCFSRSSAVVCSPYAVFFSGP